jgi:undecaprenyl phosphate N,N'-diacetylbacillosamine 1-phosphate transferase
VEINANTKIEWSVTQKIYAKIFKRIFDLFFCLLAIVILSPVYILMPMIIKLDSKGEVFFKQKRLGKNGSTFFIYKYRSMVVGAEKKGSGVYSFKDDPRVTKVGKFIRKTSIDEIPQVLNILKGEMSFIGPRPTLTYHPWKLDEYSDFQARRFLAKPGITGLAQTKGRKEIDWTKRIEYDVDYIKNISMLNDLKIFFITVFRVLAMKDNENVSKTGK